MKNQNNNIKKSNLTTQPSGLFVKAITALALPLALQVSAGCSGYLKESSNMERRNTYSPESLNPESKQNSHFSMQRAQTLTRTGKLYGDFELGFKATIGSIVALGSKYEELGSIVKIVADFENFSRNLVPLRFNNKFKPLLMDNNGKCPILNNARSCSNLKQSKELVEKIKDVKNDIKSSLEKNLQINTEFPKLLAWVVVLARLLATDCRGYNLFTAVFFPKKLDTAECIKKHKPLRRVYKFVKNNFNVNKVVSYMEMNPEMNFVLEEIVIEIEKDLKEESKNTSIASKFAQLIKKYMIDMSIESANLLREKDIISQYFCQDFKNIALTKKTI